MTPNIFQGRAHWPRYCRYTASGGLFDLQLAGPPTYAGPNLSIFGVLTLAFMLLDIHARLKDALRGAIRSQWNIDPPEVILNQTPKIELGEFATPVSFELARQVKKPPGMIAEELVARTG